MKRSKKASPRINALKKLESPSVWIEHPIVTVGIVILLATADGLNLWAAFDKVLTESIGVLIGIVLAFALCLEGIPVLIARQMKDVQYNGWSWFRKTMLVLLLCGFITVFGFAAYVKIATRDLMLSATTLGLVNVAASTPVTELSSSAKDNAFLAATIAMAALPLATSTLAFYLGWLSTDPVQAKAKRYRMYIASMQERNVALAAALEELGDPKAHRTKLIKRENELYADAMKQNAAEENLAKAIAVEAFFVGKDPNELTIIANRKEADASYTPKVSTLADVETEDAQKPSAPTNPHDRVIPVARTN